MHAATATVPEASEAVNTSGPAADASVHAFVPQSTDVQTGEPSVQASLVSCTAGCILLHARCMLLGQLYAGAGDILARKKSDVWI